MFATAPCCWPPDEHRFEGWGACWGGRERVSDALSVAGPASVPRSLGCPHERHRSGWAAADECAIATPDEKAPPAGASGANVIFVIGFGEPDPANLARGR